MAVHFLLPNHIKGVTPCSVPGDPAKVGADSNIIAHLSPMSNGQLSTITTVTYVSPEMFQWSGCFIFCPSQQKIKAFSQSINHIKGFFYKNTVVLCHWMLLCREIPIIPSEVRHSIRHGHSHGCGRERYVMKNDLQLFRTKFGTLTYWNRDNLQTDFMARNKL